MQKSNHTHKRIVITLVLIFNLLFIILSACEKKPPPLKIKTHTPSPTATPTCPPNIQLSTPDGWETTSRLFVILFDPRIDSMGEQYLELANGKKIQDPSTFIKQVLPSLMGPGDHVAILQLGHDTYSAARVTSLDSYIKIPQLYNPPVPRSTLTPVPKTTQTPPPGYEAVLATNTAAVYLTSVANTEVANIAAFNCEIDICGFR